MFDLVMVFICVVVGPIGGILAFQAMNEYYSDENIMKRWRQKVIDEKIARGHPDPYHKCSKKA